MKGSELKQVLDLYFNQASFRRRYFPSEAIKRLKLIYETKPNQDVTAEVKGLLAMHWEEVKGTSRSYLKNKLSNLKATEKAYVKLAEMVDAPVLEEKKQEPKQQESKQSQPVRIGSYFQINTLIPNLPTPFNTKVNLADNCDYYKDAGWIFQFRPWVDELNLGAEKDEKKIMKCLLGKYDLPKLKNLKVALSYVKASPSVSVDVFRRIYQTVTRLVDKFDYYKDLHACTNTDDPIDQIPPERFFRSQDNIGLDINTLFQTDFCHPETGRRLVAEDLTKLKAHPQLEAEVTAYLACRDVWEQKELTQECKDSGDHQLKNIFSRLVKHHDKASLLQLQKILNNTQLSRVPSDKIKLMANAIKKHIYDFEYFKDLHMSKNKESGGIPLVNISPRYFFRTKDDTGLDIRILFLTGFINPNTGKPIEADDLEKLKKHPHLGFSVMVFHNVKDIFRPEEKSSREEAKVMSLDMLTFAWMSSALSDRQNAYAHFMNLVDLFFHLDSQFIKSMQSQYITKKYKTCFLSFISHLDQVREKVLWSEMTDEVFFDSAWKVIKQVKNEMDDWNEQTERVFKVLRDFALRTDWVLDNTGRRSRVDLHGEYLIRVEDLTTREGLRAGMLNLVRQYKVSFDIAYRYDKLPSLMEAMTGYQICMAEKMKHLAAMFTAIGSLGPVQARLVSEHDFFAKLMAKARQAEGIAYVEWKGPDFLNYLAKNFAGKKYIKNGEETTLDKTAIEDYLRDVLGLDGFAPRVKARA